MIGLLMMVADVPPILAVPRGVLIDDRLAGSRSTRSALLAWPAPTRLAIVQEDADLVIRSDQPVSEDSVARVRDAAGEAIDDLRWNDASLVVRPAAGWSMRWQQRGSDIFVSFVADTPDGFGAAMGSGDAAEIARVRVQADLAAGYPGRARRGAAALLAHDPDDRQAARLLADAQAVDGDQSAAASAYRAMAADDRAARRIVADSAGTISLSATVRDGDALTQTEAALRIDAPIAPRVSAGGGVRVIASRVAVAGRTEREREPVIDATVTAAVADRTRLALVASAALDDRVTGGGVRIVRGSAEAQLRASATYRIPDFSTVAQVLGRGTLSRITLGGTRRLSSGLIVQADGGWNRYGLAGQDGDVSTVTLAGGLDLILRRQFPTLGLSYRVEAEYVGAASDGLAPLFLTDRENHTAQGVIGANLGDVSITGLAGWTLDRFGGDGPTASLGLNAPIGIGWRIEASAGITSVSRQGFGDRQVFARAGLTRSLGSGR